MFMYREPQASPSAEALAHITALDSAQSEYQHDVQQQRDYYAGRQFIRLTDRLRSFLGGNVGLTDKDFKRLRLNIFRTVITAMIERLIVSSITTDEIGEIAPLIDAKGQTILDANGQPQAGVVKPLATWAWRTWQQNRMDANQRRLYTTVLRDSEAFMVVTWDDAVKCARFVLHPRFVDSAAGGDSYGCTAFYENEDPYQPLLFITKRWEAIHYDGGARVVRSRMTIYYPDRIEKYIGFENAWTAYQDYGDPSWPLPWTDPKSGAPLGIPIVHFRNTAGFDAVEAIGPQNAINKTLIDLLAAADLTAFRILIALGWKPVDDKGNPLPIDPGTWVGTEKQPASVTEVAGADLTNLSDQVYNWIQWCAMVTDTPVSRFTSSRLHPAEGTLKQQDAVLLNKIRARQSELASGITDMFVIARRLHNAFWHAPALAEEALITLAWEPTEARDETEELTQAGLKLALGIPKSQIWQELGYSDVQIAQWEADAERRRQETMRQMQQQADQAQQSADQGAQNGKPMPMDMMT